MILDSTAALGYVPKRIVSLVPSQTELLHWLGLEEETVGITKFCVHPRTWFISKTRVGGTKTVKRVMIDQLRPDLIIANKEENVKEQVETLAKNYPIWLTDVKNLADALNMIKDIGNLTGKEKKANQLNEDLNKGFESIHSQLPTSTQKLQTCYLIWRNPYITIGGDTFIHDMLTRCGFENIFAKEKRYPEINLSQLQTANYQLPTINCQLLLLSSEPYPFKQKHVDELQILLPGTKIVLVDGELFSWYGSRLLNATEYFKNLISSVL